MEQIQIFKEQYEHFENIWQTDENGIEFMYARDLQKELKYVEWRKFQKPISKAKNSCESNKIDISNHFVHRDKMVETGSGASRKIEDIKLSWIVKILVSNFLV